MTLREEILAAMKAHGVSAYFLAKTLDIPKSSLSRFLSGERGLRTDNLDKLRHALGLTNGK